MTVYSRSWPTAWGFERKHFENDEFDQDSWGVLGTLVEGSQSPAEIDAFVVDDFVITTGGLDVVSRTKFKEWAAAFMAKINDLQFEVIETFQNEDGSRVASRWRIVGKNNGLLGTPPDQQPISFTGTAVWAVREDGKLCHNWVERSSFWTVPAIEPVGVDSPATLTIREATWISSRGWKRLSQLPKQEYLRKPGLSCIGATEDLCRSGIVNRVVRVGQKVPTFDLVNQRWDRVNSEGLLAKGPLVVSFYRGVWWPYCNAELEALQQNDEQITALGASLVAISPQLERFNREMSQRHKLTFDVLSDHGNRVATEFGLTFQLPEDCVGSTPNSGSIWRNTMAMIHGPFRSRRGLWSIQAVQFVPPMLTRITWWGPSLQKRCGSLRVWGVA
jgi:peroxiredoxin